MVVYPLSRHGAAGCTKAEEGTPSVWVGRVYLVVGTRSPRTCRQGAVRRLATADLHTDRMRQKVSGRLQEPVQPGSAWCSEGYQKPARAASLSWVRKAHREAGSGRLLGVYGRRAGRLISDRSLWCLKRAESRYGPASSWEAHRNRIDRFFRAVGPARARRRRVEESAQHPAQTARSRCLAPGLPVRYPII